MFLPSLSEIKLIALAVAFAGVAAGGFTMGYRWEAKALDDYKIAVANANAKATDAALAQQREFDNIAIDSAQHYGTEQATRAAGLQRQLTEVNRHVKALATRSCVTYGLVRVLDGAAGGAGADAFPLPTGKSDDDCAPAGFDWRALAGSVVRNYGTARENAAQLDALIGTIRRFQAARPK